MATIDSIKNFRFSIGGYLSAKFQFELERNDATFCGDYYNCNFGVKHHKEVTDSDIAVFLSRLNEINLLKWEKEYQSDILDGIQWELELVYNVSKKKRIYGSNAYPDYQGVSSAQSPIFKKLLSAIKELIREPLFFSDEFISN